MSLTAGALRLGYTARDGSVEVDVETVSADRLGGTLFSAVEEASQFFRAGSLGWSAGRDGPPPTGRSTAAA